MVCSEFELKPSEIARFFHLEKCPKYIYWIGKRDDRDVEEYTKNVVDEILAREGENFERRQLEVLSEVFGIDAQSVYEKFNRLQPKELVDIIKQAIIVSKFNYYRAILYQPRLIGKIGRYKIHGNADIVLIKSKNSQVEIWIFEAKYTNEEKVPHIIQAVIYAKLIRDLILENFTEPEVEHIDIYVSVLTKKNRLENLDSKESLKTNIKYLKFPQDTRMYEEILNEELGKGGKFDKILTGKEVPRFWISRKCQDCPYEPLCIKEAVEKKGLELLGIKPGEQEILEEIGIRNLEDLSELYEYPPKFSPVDFRPLKPRNEDAKKKIHEILKRTEIKNLQKLAQGAYRFLREINRTNEKDYLFDWIQGSGYNLPIDMYYEDTPVKPKYPPGSLIRVYIFVQHDPIHDKVVLLSAIVENTLTLPEKGHRRISELIDDIVDDEEKMNKLERELLDRFFKQLINAIKDVHPRINLDEFYKKQTRQKHQKTLDGVVTAPSLHNRDKNYPWIGPEDSKKYGYVHIYFYSRFQRNKLMEAIKRHREIYGKRAIRWLLGLRREIDQEMVSIIQDEIRKRHALRFPGLGIIQTVSQYRANGKWFEWDNLPSKFEELFKIAIRKEVNSKGIRLLLAPEKEYINIGNYGFSGSVYPVKHRDLEQIPLRYIWTAVKNGNEEARANLCKLGEYFALAIRHIERGIPDQIGHVRD